MGFAYDYYNGPFLAPLSLETALFHGFAARSSLRDRPSGRPFPSLVQGITQALLTLSHSKSFQANKYEMFVGFSYVERGFQWRFNELDTK